MRVISGSVGGRSLKSVTGLGTRPTTDKVKEAIFSKIGPFFEGGYALDLFAGTGGLGIEALSRGIDKAIFIDKEGKSIKVVMENLASMGLADQAEVFRNDAVRALKALVKRKIKFDLVFIDPPYKLKIADELIQFMDENLLLESKATIVIEHDAAHIYSTSIGRLQIKSHTTYGDTAITIYTYIENIDSKEAGMNEFDT